MSSWHIVESFFDGEYDILDVETMKIVCRRLSLATAEQVRLTPLISDILEHLQRVTDQLENVGDMREHKDGKIVREAREIIAKIKGEK